MNIKIWLSCMLWSLALFNHKSKLSFFVNAGELAVPASRCPAARKSLNNLLSNVENAEVINFEEEINLDMEKGEFRRLQFTLNASSPLLINLSSFSVNVAKKLLFNQTVNLLQHVKHNSKEILLPCAMNGVYDLLLNSRRKGQLRVEIFDRHPFSNWKLLNRTTAIRVRYQNRMQKRQMILKWSKSKLDIHAMHYCLVLNNKKSYKNFCEAIRTFLAENESSMKNSNNCTFVSSYLVSNNDHHHYFYKKGERVRKIIPDSINIICTKSKSHQILKGLQSNTKYFVDIFGVHTKLKNLTFLLKSTIVWFNRTHPKQIRENEFNIEKISGMTSSSVFSFKVPSSINAASDFVKYLIIPCGGSQIDVKFLKRRQKIKLVKDIYSPTYITIENVKPADRHIIRINPSNEDEVLKANKVGIGITTKDTFENLPELPLNTSLFEKRSFRNCDSTTIAWYSSPEKRSFRYCIVIFNFLGNNNKSSSDQTNYCLDFNKKITRHPQFFSKNCFEPKKKQQQKLEYSELLNLTPGESYLVYVTINLVGDGRPLPYRSLKIYINKHCHNDLLDDNSMIWNSKFNNNSSY